MDVPSYHNDGVSYTSPRINQRPSFWIVMGYGLWVGVYIVIVILHSLTK